MRTEEAMDIRTKSWCQPRRPKALYGNFKDHKSGKPSPVFHQSNLIVLHNYSFASKYHLPLQITWQGLNIVVFNDVKIIPPYKVEDVNGSPDSRQLNYVKKIVEKFYSKKIVNEQAEPEETTT